LGETGGQESHFLLKTNSETGVKSSETGEKPPVNPLSKRLKVLKVVIPALEGPEPPFNNSEINVRKRL